MLQRGLGYSYKDMGIKALLKHGTQWRTSSVPASVFGQILSPPRAGRTARTSFSVSYDKSAVRVLPFIGFLWKFGEVRL